MGERVLKERKILMYEITVTSHFSGAIVYDISMGNVKSYTATTGRWRSLWSQPAWGTKAWQSILEY